MVVVVVDDDKETVCVGRWRGGGREGWEAFLTLTPVCSKAK